MPRKHRKRKVRRVGAAPGTLHISGEAQKATMRCMTITPDELHEAEVTPEELAAQTLAPGSTQWIAMEGLEDVEQLRALGDALGIHTLSLEDILNPEHLPKLDIFDTYAFVVMNECRFVKEEHAFLFEPVSLLLMEHRVISFHAAPRDTLFAPVLERLQGGAPRIRSSADYLFYALLDLLVDRYYPVFEEVEDEIEALEAMVLEEAEGSTLQRIHDFRRGIAHLMKVVMPIREVANGLRQGRSPLVGQQTKLYVGDVVDHAAYLAQTLEQFREMLNGIVDLYMSMDSNRMNQVMKVLTIIATIFIPLTFIAGLYGMNFQNMPELQWDWGYPMALVAMSVVAVIMLLYFRRKKWL